MHVTCIELLTSCVTAPLYKVTQESQCQLGPFVVVLQYSLLCLIYIEIVTENNTKPMSSAITSLAVRTQNRVEKIVEIPYQSTTREQSCTTTLVKLRQIFKAEFI